MKKNRKDTRDQYRPDEPPVDSADAADNTETRETTGETLKFNEEADSFELDDLIR